MLQVAPSQEHHCHLPVHVEVSPRKSVRPSQHPPLMTTLGMLNSAPQVSGVGIQPTSLTGCVPERCAFPRLWCTMWMLCLRSPECALHGWLHRTIVAPKISRLSLVPKAILHSPDQQALCFLPGRGDRPINSRNEESLHTHAFLKHHMFSLRSTSWREADFNYCGTPRPCSMRRR